MQPANLPPRTCPNCGERTLTELLTGEPLDATPVQHYREQLWRWHRCNGHKPSKPRLEPDQARNFRRASRRNGYGKRRGFP